MQVRKILVSYYTTDEIVTLAKNILARTEGLTPAHVAVTALSASLTTAYQTLLSSRTRTTHNTQTNLLIEADRVRDAAFRAFCGYVEAGTFRQNTAYRTACLAIMEHIEKFDRNLVRFGYARQSVELARFFAEMEQETANLATIGATDWLTELKAAETAFAAQYASMVEEDRKKNTLVPVKTAKEQVLNQLLAMVNILNGLALADTEGIAALNSGIDEDIEKVEIPAKARLKRRANED